MAEHVEHVAAPAGAPAGLVASEKNSNPIVPILTNPVPAPPRSLRHYSRRLSVDSEEKLEKAKRLQRLHREGRGS